MMYINAYSCVITAAGHWLRTFARAQVRCSSLPTCLWSWSSCWCSTRTNPSTGYWTTSCGWKSATRKRTRSVSRLFKTPSLWPHTFSRVPKKLSTDKGNLFRVIWQRQHAKWGRYMRSIFFFWKEHRPAAVINTFSKWANRPNGLKDSFFSPLLSVEKLFLYVK